MFGQEIGAALAPFAKWGALVAGALLAAWYLRRKRRKDVEKAIVADHQTWAQEIEDEASTELDATPQSGAAAILARVRARRRRRERLRD